MSRSRSLTLVALILFLLPSALFAQAGKMEKPMMKHEMRHEMKLDHEKMLEVKKLGLELKLKNIDLMEKKDELHEQLAKEMMKDDPSDKEISRIAKDMNKIHAEIMQNRLDNLKAVRKILTAEEFGVFFRDHGFMGEGRGGCGRMGQMGKGMGDHDCMGGMGRCDRGRDGGRCGGAGDGCGEHGMTAEGRGARKAGCGEGAGDHECIRIEKKIIKE